LNQAGNLGMNLLLSLTQPLKLTIKGFEPLSQLLGDAVDGIVYRFGPQNRFAAGITRGALSSFTRRRQETEF
jgi:hypothetical protein